MPIRPLAEDVVMLALRRQSRRTLDQWLNPLVAADRVARDGRRSRWFARRHLLLDSAARTVAQERFHAALAPAPDRRCAALAVLAGHAGLLPWAVLDDDPIEPLVAAAERLAAGVFTPFARFLAAVVAA